MTLSLSYVFIIVLLSEKMASIKIHTGLDDRVIHQSFHEFDDYERCTHGFMNTDKKKPKVAKKDRIVK